MKTDQCQYFKPGLLAMLFKEVDSKFSFEFDKDFTLKQIFLLIIIKLEYKQDYAFKIFKRGVAKCRYTCTSLGKVSACALSLQYTK